MTHSPIVPVTPGDDEALYAAIERSLAAPAADLTHVPTLTGLALGDPFLAEQLAELHRAWEVRPAPAHGLLARLRTRLAWWLLGPEIRQGNDVNATLVRVIDSLVVQLDQERQQRRQAAEQLANAE